MNILFTKILDLIENKNIRISAHGYDELAEDGILVKDVLANIKNAILLEEYSDYPKGPCLLLLQKDIEGNLFMLFGEYLEMQILRLF